MTQIEAEELRQEMLEDSYKEAQRELNSRRELLEDPEKITEFKEYTELQKTLENFKQLCHNYELDYFEELTKLLKA